MDEITQRLLFYLKKQLDQIAYGFLAYISNMKIPIWEIEGKRLISRKIISQAFPEWCLLRILIPPRFGEFSIRYRYILDPNYPLI